MEGDAAELTLKTPMHVTITEPRPKLQIVFQAIPQGDGEATLTVNLLRRPTDYNHIMIEQD